MPAKRLEAGSIGLPSFTVPPAPPEAPPAYPFDLSSHRRAGQALKFGLSIKDPGFNIFVLGENRSGRMTATLNYLGFMARERPASEDWVYLFNFRRPHKPKPYRLKRGVGRVLRDRMATLIPMLRKTLHDAFEHPTYTQQLRGENERLRESLTRRYEEVDTFAKSRGLKINRTEQGITVASVDAAGNQRPWDTLSAEEQQAVQDAARDIGERMRVLGVAAERAEAEAGGVVRDIRRHVANGVLDQPLMQLEEEFGQPKGLRRWIIDMREDLLDHLDQFLAELPAGQREGWAERYMINLVVDNTDEPAMPVVLEPNPTYPRLFGAIEYRAVSGALETDFRMLRAGALHRANGGILVLRAEAVAREPGVWEALKGALRDGEVRIEEPRRSNLPALVESLQPKPIPLQVKVVLVGHPTWYYAFFSADPNFQDYFKVKADIDPDMESTPENLSTYARLIREAAQQRANGATCADAAVATLLGQASRWAQERGKLTSKFEMVDDVLVEAERLIPPGQPRHIDVEHIRRALNERRRRNARIEDRSQESIRKGLINIRTDGTAPGQVNALTVLDLGDHGFGMPSRVSARVYAGRIGIINIERQVEMGGPIQQKGVLILEGFLNGRFAQRFPLSFSASITFEQNYGGVEGDSASMAELVAVVSALSEIPIRQDIAITGSMDQNGQAQAIGGGNFKIEGFFRLCNDRGLTGRQGVIVPKSNEQNLALREEVAEAVKAGKFHVWSVATVDEAVEMLLGIKPGEADARGAYKPGTVYGRVMKKLEGFDRILTKRAAHRV